MIIGCKLQLLPGEGPVSCIGNGAYMQYGIRVQRVLDCALNPTGNLEETVRAHDDALSGHLDKDLSCRHRAKAHFVGNDEPPMAISGLQHKNLET